MSYNNEKPQDVNTYGPSFFNESEMTRLSTSHWKGNLSLAIEDVRRDDKNYLKGVENTQTKISISGSTISTLETVVESIIDQLKSTGKFECEGVECGVQTNNFIEISDGSNIDKAPGLYLVIYKDLNDDRLAKSLKAYKFNSRISVKGYNCKSGSGKAVKRDIQELKDFKRILSESAKAATKAMAHSVKDSLQSDTAKTYKALASICAANGINLMEEPRKSNNNGGNRKNSFTSNSEDMELEFGDYDFSAVETFEIN